MHILDNTVDTNPIHIWTEFYIVCDSSVWLTVYLQHFTQKFVDLALYYAPEFTAPDRTEKNNNICIRNNQCDWSPAKFVELMLERRNSTANALDLRLSCMNTSNYSLNESNKWWVNKRFV